MQRQSPCEGGAQPVPKRGVVREQDLQTVVVEFPPERCENCSCALGLAAQPQSVTFFRHEFGEFDGGAFSPGQRVEVRLPTRQLSLASAVLFGGPLLGAFLCGALANMAQVALLIQGAVALAGFALGGLASYFLRDQLQTSVYSRLSITPLDC